MSSLRQVYDEDNKKIENVGIDVQRLWRDLAPTINLANTKDTAKKLNEWTKVVEGAFERIGFRAAVDVNPIYGDMPPDITILERITSRNEEFDHERKAREIKREKDLA